MDKVKILVVDDESRMRKLVRDFLTRQNYEVLEAADGEEALDVFYEQKDIALIILDVMMPKMNGWEVCREIRQTSKVPIIMLTAKGEDTDKLMGFDCGADDYMTKPVDTEEMLLRIKALLRRAKIVSERKIEIGDVVLDYDSLTVTRGKERQELPQKEFLLLYKLLSYPGKIFTRIQLMDEIWGMDSETGWETVTVHIGRLRKRFEAWPEFEIISVRGLGYKAVKKV